MKYKDIYHPANYKELQNIKQELMSLAIAKVMMSSHESTTYSFEEDKKINRYGSETIFIETICFNINKNCIIELKRKYDSTSNTYKHLNDIEMKIYTYNSETDILDGIHTFIINNDCEQFKNISNLFQNAVIFHIGQTEDENTMTKETKRLYKSLDYLKNS